MQEAAKKFIEKLITLTEQNQIMWLVEKDDRSTILATILGPWKISVWDSEGFGCNFYISNNDDKVCFNLSIEIETECSSLISTLIRKIRERQRRWKSGEFRCLHSQAQPECFSKLLEFAEKL